MPKALSQNLETIAALQSFCIFGYQTDDPLAAVAAEGYFASCAARLMANDLILICADAQHTPAWGLFLVRRVGPEGVILENVAGLSPDTIEGLTFLRSPVSWNAAKAKTARSRRTAA